MVVLSSIRVPPLLCALNLIGTDESDMEAFNAELCKLGLRGMSVFVSSGSSLLPQFSVAHRQVMMVLLAMPSVRILMLVPTFLNTPPTGSRSFVAVCV